MARPESGSFIGNDVGTTKPFNNVDVKRVSGFKKPSASAESDRGLGGNIKVKVGSTKSLGNMEIKAVEGFKKSHLSQKKPSSVADHEATHAALLILRGKQAKRATIIQEGDALGSVEPDVFDEVAAVGPHAKGSSGTGWDIFLTKQRGYNVGNAISTARSLINVNEEPIRAIGNALDEKKTMTHYDIKKVMDQAIEEKNKQPTAHLLVTDSNGGQREIKNVPLNHDGSATVPIDLVEGQWAIIPGKKAVAG